MWSTNNMGRITNRKSEIQQYYPSDGRDSGQKHIWQEVIFHMELTWTGGLPILTEVSLTISKDITKLCITNNRVGNCLHL